MAKAANRKSEAHREFVAESFTADVPDGDRALYSVLSDHVNQTRPDTFVAEPGVWDSWSWDSVHRARASETTGWRLLIRVSETNDLPARKAGFIRPQSQVYIPAPESYGW